MKTLRLLLVVSVLGIGASAVRANLPNCAVYPEACANYQAAHTCGSFAGMTMLAGLAMCIGVGSVGVIVARRRRQK